MGFGSGLLYAEVPVDPGLRLVTFLFQGLDLPAEGLLVWETLTEVTAGEYAEPNLRHIEPTAVLGRVVELQSLGDAPGLRSRKDLVGTYLRPA